MTPYSGSESAPLSIQVRFSSQHLDLAETLHDRLWGCLQALKRPPNHGPKLSYHSHLSVLPGEVLGSTPSVVRHVWLNSGVTNVN